MVGRQREGAREESAQASLAFAARDLWQRLRGVLARRAVEMAIPGLRPVLSTYSATLLRNAPLDAKVDRHLAELRLEIESVDPGTFERGSNAVLEYFDSAHERMNVIIQLAQSWAGQEGLDVGTAYGFYATILRRHYGLRIVGSERAPFIPTFCRFALAQGQVIVPWDIGQEPCPFEQKRFDFVIFAEILEHLKLPPRATLRLLASLLKPGGHLLLTTPNIARRENILALALGINILESFPEELGWGQDPTDHVMHVREYTIDEVICLVQEAGLSIVDVLMCGWSPGGARLDRAPSPATNEITCILARSTLGVDRPSLAGGAG